MPAAPPNENNNNNQAPPQDDFFGFSEGLLAFGSTCGKGCGACYCISILIVYAIYSFGLLGQSDEFLCVTNQIDHHPYIY